MTQDNTLLLDTTPPQETDHGDEKKAKTKTKHYGRFTTGVR